jgi:hypothetical protein
MCKNTVDSERSQTTWCMCIACLITKATDTHSKYVILFVFVILLKYLSQQTSVSTMAEKYSMSQGTKAAVEATDNI